MFCALFSCVVLDVSWGSRTLLLDSFIMLAIFFLLTTSNKQKSLGKKKYKKIVIFLFFIITFGFLGQFFTDITRGEDKKIGDTNIPSGIGYLSLYYSQTLVTFDQTLNKNKPTYGLMSFGGLLNVLHLFRIYRNENLFIYDVMLDWEKDNPYFGLGSWIKKANTYSWLRYLYSDFGVFGLILLPFILGFISGKQYIKISKKSFKKHF